MSNNDLTVVLPAQDLRITVVPQDPAVGGAPDDLDIAIPPPDITVVPRAPDDMVVVPLTATQVAVKQDDLAVTMSFMGPPGPAGPQADEITIDRVAAQALGGNRVVKPVAGNMVDYASSAVATDGDLILGITQGAVAGGNLAAVQTGGEMTEPGWDWEVGPVYCGLDGVLTQVPPTNGFVCRVAKAISPTTIFINVEEAITLA